MGEPTISVELWNFDAFRKDGGSKNVWVTSRHDSAADVRGDLRLCEWTLFESPRPSPPPPLKAAFDDKAAEEARSGTVMSHTQSCAVWM